MTHVARLASRRSHTPILTLIQTYTPTWPILFREQARKQLLEVVDSVSMEWTGVWRRTQKGSSAAPSA